MRRRRQAHVQGSIKSVVSSRRVAMDKKRVEQRHVWLPPATCPLSCPKNRRTGFQRFQLADRSAPLVSLDSPNIASSANPRRYSKHRHCGLLRDARNDTLQV